MKEQILPNGHKIEEYGIFDDTCNAVLIQRIKFPTIVLKLGESLRYHSDGSLTIETSKGTTKIVLTE